MKKLLNLSVLIFIVYGSFKAMAQENSPFLEEESDLESPFEFGGFGELHYTYNLPTKIANATTVIGLFEMDYHFNDRIGLHSEVSFEGDHFSNFDEFEAQQLGELDRENEFEVELEEMYLLFKLNSRMRLKTGLFIMRSGLVAERHNPTTYRSVRMPEAETRIIPGHWKEIGVELHGKWKGRENLHYSFGVVSGLNAAHFKGGSGIREGRSGGVNASASNIGLTGSLHLYAGHSRFQTSLYYGGTFGVSNQRAKELGLKNGLFGTPVFLPEVNYKYEHKGWDVRGVMALMYLHDAQKINRAFDRNVAKMAIGGYGEVAYNLLGLNNPETTRILYLTIPRFFS